MSEREIEKQISDNQNLIYFVIKNNFPFLIQDEDIVQSGMIGLWKACISYDEAKSAFSTYAITCIKNEINYELRKRQKYERLDVSISLNDRFETDGDQKIELIDTIPDEDNEYSVIDYDLSFLKDKISERDYKIFIKFANGMSMSDIAKEIKLTRSRVSFIINEIRSIIRKEYLSTERR